MADEADYAVKIREQEVAAACVVARYEHLIIFVTDEGIQEASFTGTGGGCSLYMEEALGLDMLNGRWARGHDEKSIKASDGEMERELRIRLMR